MDPRSEPDPASFAFGRSGERSFRFRCRRSGNCCRVRGYVWLAPGEDQLLAQSLSLSPEAFRRRFVRTVPCPRTGVLREALTERLDGRCALLEGHNECGVYSARPEHCRRFPFWSSISNDPAAFERALELCPGLEEEKR